LSGLHRDARPAMSVAIRINEVAGRVCISRVLGGATRDEERRRKRWTHDDVSMARHLPRARSHFASHAPASGATCIPLERLGGSRADGRVAERVRARDDAADAPREVNFPDTTPTSARIRPSCGARNGQSRGWGRWRVRSSPFGRLIFQIRPRLQLPPSIRPGLPRMFFLA
jgi:hypothetical protein